MNGHERQPAEFREASTGWWDAFGAWFHVSPQERWSYIIVVALAVGFAVGLVVFTH